jgi:hypothetical protein
MDEEPLIQKELHGTKPLKHRTEEEEIKVPHKSELTNEQSI